MDDETLGWLRIALTPGIGRKRLWDLMKMYPSSEEALRAGPSGWLKSAGVPEEIGRGLGRNDRALQGVVTALEKVKAKVLTWHSPDYPALLREIYDPPAILFTRGSCETGNCLAVVGTRKGTAAMLAFTRDLCRGAARAGLTIVSGAARGIDGSAHVGALDGGGKTIAVLGCGIDVAYPAEHRELLERICAQGMLISEYPPGTKPLAGHFPARNRIIAGLARGVLVVEASATSGALITADFALQNGREVFAVPGPVYAESSTGANRLLGDGAHLVMELGDLLGPLGLKQQVKPGRPLRRETPGSTEDASAGAPSLLEEDAVLCRLLAGAPRHVDELIQQSGLTPSDVSARLLDLELRGVVTRLPGMHFILK
ncbi:MAG: DNA-processing protein DprA [bacterium]|nr:DNA-processing protein DprA [bacterium]